MPLDDPDIQSIPWWYCEPKVPVTPCPIRPTGFVVFADYDSDFKYPLASSRMPIKTAGNGCACPAPELLTCITEVLRCCPSGPPGPPCEGGWVPIAQSETQFTQNLDDGITMAGSTLRGTRTGYPGDQVWVLELLTPARVRINVLAFDSGPYSQSGMFMLGSDPVLNSGSAGVWEPNPVISEDAVSSVMYSSGENSDYPTDAYRMLVEVWMDCVDFDIKPE